MIIVIRALLLRTEGLIGCLQVKNAKFYFKTYDT